MVKWILGGAVILAAFFAAILWVGYNIGSTAALVLAPIEIIVMMGYGWIVGPKVFGSRYK